jgi:hypothetical protein
MRVSRFALIRDGNGDGDFRDARRGSQTRAGFSSEFIQLTTLLKVNRD